MFYRKRISALEDRVDALEVRVKELYVIVSKYCQDVDDFLASSKVKENPVKPEALKPRRRPKRRNGKETPKVTE